MTVRPVEELLYHMPTVARMAGNDWATGFAKSIIRQSRRRNWQPSTKQLSVMQALVSDLFVHCGDEEGDFDVIE